ncbi:MAG TPA: hypothetical protein VF691_10230 [Cytophagaceae bacterium]
MIENLPIYISLLFSLTTLITLFLFSQILQQSSLSKSSTNYIILGMVIWLVLQAFLTLFNFYNIETTSNPPRFILLVAPPFILTLLVLVSKKGQALIDTLSLKALTFIHIVRIPVEIVLYWLSLNKAVPELMTFSGRNFDILVGITAPFVSYFGIEKRWFSKKILLLWNFVSLGLLVNIVVNAVLSSPVSFQKFAFDQPNIAVTHFPFSWLPCFIVPIALFCHLAAIRKLLAS